MPLAALGGAPCARRLIWRLPLGALPSSCARPRCPSARRVHTTTASTSSTTTPPAPPPHLPPRSTRLGVVAAAAALVVGALGTALVPAPLHAEPPAAERLYRLDDIKAHDGASGAPWIISGNRVYDITDWVPAHPGGDVILRAAGKSIEAYWNIFRVHHQQYVRDLLEQFFIGLVDPRDLVNGQVPADAIDDPFAEDPARDESFILRTEKPCNAETPPGRLASYLTPNHLFYVRNHLWVPPVADPDAHTITIELPDGSERAYTLADLRAKFPQHTVTAVLQCSGNRRAHMSAHAAPTMGLPWDVGAIGNAEWTGVRLRDVLADAGFPIASPPPEIQHAQFLGADAYGASIPLAKALDAAGDALLVFAMNGASLPRDHGFPVRVLIPGSVAARSVKWVTRITLSADESHSQWQRRDYKCFGPNVRSNPDWTAAPAIQEMPVQSAVTAISPAAAAASTVVEGYAYSGGGRRIIRVDVSTDAGRTWRQAEMLARAGAAQTPEGAEQGRGCRAWGWTRWRLEAPAADVRGQVLVKAVDEAYNTQPSEYAPTWNVRGNLTNAWHRVDVGGGGRLKKGVGTEE